MKLNAIGFVVLLGLSWPGLSGARCLDEAGDAAAIAAGRAAVDASCDCTLAQSHGRFVKCAATVARELVASRALRPECRRSLLRCAALSTCGRPGSVTCCYGSGETSKCRLRSSAARCALTGGTVGTCNSCCDACDANGWQAPESAPVGNESTTLTAAALSTPPPLPIVRGDTWNYVKGTSEPPAAWTTIGFDDSGWLSGPSGFGYGDQDDATLLGDMQNSYSTVYTRHAFDVPAPGAVTALVLKVDYDDGFVAYLNGTEVARRNAPAGVPPFDALAPVAHEASGGTNGNPPETISVGTGLLVAGTNVLAVQGLNVSLGSSDLSLIVELSEVNAPPDPPADPSPAPGTTGAPLNPTLCVDVSDLDGDSLTTTFYGREVTGATAADFTIIALPDTQYYAASYPATYNAQTQWIVDNRVARNIAYVTELGDCVDNATINQQLVNADAAWNIIETNPYAGQPAGIPFGIAVGNHDQAPNGDPGTLADEGLTTTAFNSWFGVSRFAGRGYYGGHYGSNNDNHYDLFSASGMDFVALFIEYMPSDSPLRQAVLAWADGVLKAYPGRRAIVTSHYLLESGTSTAFGNQGQAIYDALKGNANLFLMLAGHLDQASRRTDTFNGNAVHTLKSDYQTRPNGGDGWLRIMTFSPANDTIHVQTYSPTLGQFINTHPDNTAGTAENDFVLDYDMDGGTPFATIGTNVQPSGGTACVVWSGLQPGKQYEWYVTVSDGEAVTTGTNAVFTTALTCAQDSDCQDGNLCNGTESCVASACQPGTPLDCDDANACTTDSCDAATGCQHVTISCDDNDLCTTDTCSVGLGCQHTTVSCPAGEVCSAQTGLCGSPAMTCSTSGECNDGNPCTTDTCTGTGAALTFNGSSQYVTMGAAAGEAALGARAFTLEAWIKRDGANWGATASTGNGGVTAVPLVTKGRGEAENSNVDMNYFLGILQTTGRPVADFEQFAAAAGWSAGQNHPACSTALIADTNWHHVAVTYSTTTGWHFYVDGVEGTTSDGTVCATGGACSPAGSCPQSPGVEPRYDSIQHFGLATAMTSTGAAQGFLAGKLDEVRVWNVVRTQAEIQAAMSQQLTSGTGLIGRWGLNEGSGTSAADSTSPAENGTLMPPATPPSWETANVPLVDGSCSNTLLPNCLICNGNEECIDTDLCNGTESCVGGVCQAGIALACDDGNPCTVDSCDSVDGCQHAAIPGCCATAADCNDGNGCTTDACAVANTAALAFDGTDDYVTMGAAAGLGAQSFTIETWFYRTGAGTGNTTGSGGITSLVPLVAKGAPEADGSNVDANYVLGINTAGNVIAADFEDFNSGLNHPVSGSTVIATNTWYHAAATYDAVAGTWNLYLNGNLEPGFPQTVTGTTNVKLPRYDSIQHFGLGAMLTSSGSRLGAFQGRLDEVRVWNVARTQAEIQAALTEQLTSGTGLIGRWGLNEGGGGSAADSTSPAEDGTLTNGPAWSSTNLPSLGTNQCTYTPAVGAACSDGDPCTTGETCNGSGVCAGGIAADCSDGIACTTDSCDPELGCVHAETPGACDDGESCTADACTTANPSALGFDGGGDYVSFGAASTHTELGLEQFTLEGWVQWDGTAGATTSTGTGGLTAALPIVAKGRAEADATNQDMNYFLGMQGGKLAADFEEAFGSCAGGPTPAADCWFVCSITTGTRCSADSQCPGGETCTVDNCGGGTCQGVAGLNHPVVGTTTLLANVWYHVAATYDGDCWQLYVNGLADGAAVCTGGRLPRADSIQPFSLATAMTSTNVAAGFFPGRIDEVRVWNYARSAAEIQDGMHSRIPSDSALPTQRLVGRWGFDEGSGPTVADTAGYANDGTLNGDAVFSSTGLTTLTGCDHTPVSNGTPCDDGSPCTAGDACTAGTCDGSVVPGCCLADAECDDGNPCTADTCQANACAHTALPNCCLTPADCDDGNDCTTDECVSLNAAALAFDGTNDYVDFGNAAELTDFGTGSFTVEGWIYTDGGAANLTGIFRHGRQGAFPQVVVQLGGSAAPFRNLTASVETNTAGTQVDTPTTSTGTLVPVNAWTHFAAVADRTGLGGSQELRLYMNGALVSSANAGLWGANPISSGDSVLIGAARVSGGTPSLFYDGRIDEVRVWNYARTAGEIAADMNSEIASAPGLIHRWGLNEGTGTMTADSVAASAGTLLNGTVWSSSDLPMFGNDHCTHAAVDAGTSCNDNSACTTGETCDGNGSCGGGSAVDCDDTNPCTVDGCSPSLGCQHPPGNAGTICRPSAGICDPAETCTGSSATCPTDAKFGTATVCRGAAGVCDAPEVCNGVDTACPGDVFFSSSTVCRTAAGVCDVAETCSGASTACPADMKLGTSTTCRPAAGVCDVAEACDGSNDGCPADALEPAATECRASAGVCDVAETCTGSDAACPPDTFSPTSTECRGAAGACDVAEYCLGDGPACPADGWAPSTQECRGDAGQCDVAENCTGTSPACPPDGFEPDNTPCDDGNACVTGEACQQGTCTGGVGEVCGPCETCVPGTGCEELPRLDCFVAEPLRSKILIKDTTPDEADKVIWKWIRGAAVTTTDFGDPLATDDYAFCLYDNTGLVMQASIPAGGTCATKPCWKALNGKGFKYADKEGTPDGIGKLLLKAGEAGLAKVIMKGKGVNLSMPTMPLSLDVRAEMRGNGMCWSTIHTATGTIRNDEAQFKAKDAN